ncbi:MAG TPA: HAMP domain-containing sensor histidine kinase [Ktedonobacteraceae bacterium]|jgi:signal transduction histidine kinase|nr:HAMP domain-containing sensor histidine kinase [Ktedonobacteraceae bacterium]
MSSGIWVSILSIPASFHMAALLYPIETPSAGKDVQAGANSTAFREMNDARSGGQPEQPPRPNRWLHSFLTLRWRLASVYITLFALFSVILSLFTYNSISSSLLHDAQLAFPQRVVLLRTQLVRDLCDNVSLSNASNFLGQEEATDDLDSIYLLSASGKIISSSGGGNVTPIRDSTFQYIDPAFFSTWHPAATQAFEGESSSTSFDGLLLSVQPALSCPGKSQFQGYLAATTSYSMEHATLRNLLLVIIIAALVIIILGAIIILLLTGVMLRPLRQMIGATQAMARGNMQRRVRVPNSEDEIGALATSFNQMADRVEQLLEEQQASERRARRFVSDASHELRTPITSLRGFTEVLMRGAKDDPATAQRVLQLMKYEADRMTRLVNDLLTLARLDENRPLEMRSTDLVDIAIESVRQIRNQAQEQCKISLDLVTQERLKLQADAERLKQMLLILLDNAVKYGCSSASGSIILRLDKRDENALIQVIDRGQGIAPEDLPHVFDRFYRGQHAPASNGAPIGGTGLGLAIAIAIARAHQGTITVNSEPERGASFTVTLPCP